jgi:hypothetical protein
MRILFIAIFLVLLKDSIGQDSTKHYFKEIGWTIHLPLDFKVLSSAQNSTIVNNGKKEIEQTLDAKVNILETLNLISARKSKNYFNATLTRSNSNSDSVQASFIKSQEEIIYKAMSKDAKVDSSSTIVNVGGQMFRKFEMIVHINEKTSFGMNLATKLYNGYYFVIVYAYLDKATKEQVETMLIESKFSN